ncbi:MAG: ABC transporter ATP-binding protein [Pseudonocardia sp.]
MALLDIDDLRVHFPTAAGLVRAVDGVSLTVQEGGSLCLTGESGSGKTVVALAIVGLLPTGAMVGGQIRFDGRDLMTMPRHELRRLRGRAIGMIFEQPWNALNPTMRVGEQIAEAVRIAAPGSRRDARSRALDLMAMVDIPARASRYRQYPHEFSGGMQQRVMIAIALAGRPRLLIADEPTTALDVTVQAQIVDLLREVTEETGASLLLVTHDLDVGASLCEELAVMYAGEIIESGRLQKVEATPRHPYTQMLLHAVADDGLHPIPGTVPELSDLPSGCRFHPRCPAVMDRCAAEHPVFDADVRCWLWSR